MFRKNLGVWAMMLYLSATAPAYAYLDAGTGSMLLQLFLGGLAGIGVIAKLYWHRIVGFFKDNEDNKDIKE